MIIQHADGSATPVRNTNRRKTGNTGDNAVNQVWYLDESGRVPVITREATGIPVIVMEKIRFAGKDAYFAVIAEINPATSTMSFGVAVKADFATMTAEPVRDGKAQRYLIKRSPKPVVIWVGTIEVTSRCRAYKITGEGTLERKPISRYITVRVTNAYGITTVAEIPLMNMRATGDRAQWIDDLDLHGSSQTNMIKTAIIAMAESRDDDFTVIHGQGPAYLDSGTMIFAAKSVVYDEHGTAREDIRTDINATVRAAYLRYYDITPRKLITDEQVKDGIAELRLALTESPDYPEIPAAFTGQIYTSPLATIYRELWSGVHLSGVRGSGKTFYATRWDSVQSRDARGTLASIRPALPLGDTTGTVKGAQYRSANFGGYAVTTDDVIKTGDSEYRIREQADKIQNLVRSHETGGSARAGVDYARHEVKDGNAPELSSSLKITSEKPIPGDSLQNRLIMLPHLTATWGNGGTFNRAISERLSTPDSRELQHRAWSAYVHYLIMNHSMLTVHLSDAIRETETWGLADARQASRYAVPIAGHYMFREFCGTFGIDYTDDVTNAVDALRTCAIRQAGNAIPLAERFAEMLRLEIVNGRLAYMGPPQYNPDGSQSRTHTEPGIWSKTENPNTGIEQPSHDLGGFTYDELGLILSGGNSIMPHAGHNAIVRGYLVPPRTHTGGHTEDPLTRKWLIAHKRDQFTALCEQITRASRDRGWNFSPDDVIKSLTDMKTGNNDRMYVGIYATDETGKSVKRKRERYIYIDARFALKTPEGNS